MLESLIVARVISPFLFLVLLAPVSASELDPKLEQEAKAIETLLMAPCCWRQPVAVHFSPAAEQIRAEVRQMLADGLTREEILGKYIAQYGERILAKPPARGFGSLAYFLPFIFLILGAAVAVIVIGRLRPKESTTAPKENVAEKLSSSASKYAKQLDKELWG
jgi:cytochrome c-type biogenesis protein CcmH